MPGDSQLSDGRFSLSDLLLPVAASIGLVPIIHWLSLKVSQPSKPKQWGVPVEVDGPGVAYRHRRYPELHAVPHGGGDTVTALFAQACTRFPNKPLLGTRKLILREYEAHPVTGEPMEKLTQGEYEWLTYSQVQLQAQHLAAGLAGLGHGQGELIAIVADTRAEWFIALQAAHMQGLAVVTVYASLGEEALVHCLRETQVTTVITDSQQFKKLLNRAHELTSVRRVVVMEEQDGAFPLPPKGELPPNVDYKCFQEVMEIGLAAPVPPHPPSPADVAIIMYTSGSTGVPKGVVILHRNVVATIAAILEIVPEVSEKDVVIGYLPLAHVLELAGEVALATQGAAIGFGQPLTLTDTAPKVKQGTRGDAPTLRPTLMAAVPAIVDRIRAAVLKKVAEKGPKVQRIFNRAYSRQLAALRGDWNSAWGLESLFWKALVFSKIRGALGGKVRFLLTGGAPLSADAHRFMQIVFGMGVGQGYGLTETSAGATFTEWEDDSVGRVGAPIPCCYVKLIDWEEGGYRTSDLPMPRGEICVGGPSVTDGYFQNSAETEKNYKVDRNGIQWFHTGDVGQFHPDGALEIIDRKKDIVKLQSGEYIPLAKVEMAVKASPFVEHVMVHADSYKSFTVALVVPVEATLAEWAATQEGLESASFKELCANPRAAEAVLASLKEEAAKAKLAKFEIPAKVALLADAWTPDSGLVTSSLKMKRDVIRKTFAAELEKLYM